MTHGPGEDVAPSWSRDGRSIYFGSSRSGRHEIWKIPAEGGDAAQVTKNGGIYALESPDGQWLCYTKNRTFSGLWKMPVPGGAETQLLDSIFYLAFTLRPEGMYYW
ncbi:MAG: TolB family protein, partial [Anaerolineales bacterium]